MRVVSRRSLTGGSARSRPRQPSVRSGWTVSGSAPGGPGIRTVLAGQVAGALRVPTTSVDNGCQYRAVFTNAADAVTTAPATLTVVAADSTTWAGYVVRGVDFTAVSASWVVPTVTCTAGENTTSDQWVGIDGWSNATVEQDGTEVDCANGIPNYGAWWDPYGDPAVNNGNATTLPYAVLAGDQITASVTLSGATWTLTVTDTTRNWSVSTSEPGSSPLQAQTTAEWIVEGTSGRPGESRSAISPPPLSPTPPPPPPGRKPRQCVPLCGSADAGRRERPGRTGGSCGQQFHRHLRVIHPLRLGEDGAQSPQGLARAVNVRPSPRC
jgi:hypothetical protein